MESIKQGGEVIGNHVRVKVVKNKIAPPFKEAEFDIMFGQGISTDGDILDLAAKESIIEKSGAWYAYKGAKIGQGRENAKLYLREHQEIRDEVEKKVRIRYGLLPEEADPDPAKIKAGAGPDGGDGPDGSGAAEAGEKKRRRKTAVNADGETELLL